MKPFGGWGFVPPQSAVHRSREPPRAPRTGDAARPRCRRGRDANGSAGSCAPHRSSLAASMARSTCRPSPGRPPGRRPAPPRSSTTNGVRASRIRSEDFAHASRIPDARSSCVQSGRMRLSERGVVSDRRSSAQLLPDQRSDLSPEELDRAHGLCMINMGDMQLETIDLHQLMQPDDLGGDGFWLTEEQCAFGPNQILDSRIRHRQASHAPCRSWRTSGGRPAGTPLVPRARR